MIRAFQLVGQLDISNLPNAKNPGTDYAQNAWDTGMTVAAVTLTVVAVLMIVINGFQYITAAGDPQKMAKARQGLLFSIIGLVVIWLARTIVAWALKGVS